jgi:hypothetical protein
MFKTVHYRQNSNVEGSKVIKICNVKGKSIFNAEYYLKDC